MAHFSGKSFRHGEKIRRKLVRRELVRRKRIRRKWVRCAGSAQAGQVRGFGASGKPAYAKTLPREERRRVCKLD